MLLPVASSSPAFLRCNIVAIPSYRLTSSYFRARRCFTFLVIFRGDSSGGVAWWVRYLDLRSKLLPDDHEPPVERIGKPDGFDVPAISPRGLYNRDRQTRWRRSRPHGSDNFADIGTVRRARFRVLRGSVREAHGWKRCPVIDSDIKAEVLSVFLPALVPALLPVLAGILPHSRSPFAPRVRLNWEPNASRRETGLLIPSPSSRARLVNCRPDGFETRGVRETCLVADQMTNGMRRGAVLDIKLVSRSFPARSEPSRRSADQTRTRQPPSQSRPKPSW